MLVFGLCSIDYLVDNQTKILKLTRNIFGKKLFALLMEWTFFGQFMVREEEGKILEGLRKLNERGISPMLAYTAPELHGSVDGDGASNEPAKEQWYLNNFNSVLKSFHIAAKCYSFTKTRPIITTKVTFFVDHSLLVLLSSVIQQQNALLLHNNQLVDSFISKNPTWNTRSKESLKNDLIFHVELNKMIHSERYENHSPTKENEDVVKLQDAHLNLFEKLRGRMDKLCLTAQQTNLSLNFDAEQTYLQTAIEMLCIHFQRLYNECAPVVLNTYQCYLKRTGDVIENHVTLAKQDGFCFGGKIVRGAYIDEERRLAKEKQTVDPVNPTYAATTSMYQRVSEFLINQVKCQGEGRMRVIFATHNEDSVTDVLNRLREKEINMDVGDVSFAQLYGTRDFISYTLGSLGYPVSKMVHYSNPVDGLAYLSRRLTENRSGLASPEIERRLPVVELKRRLFERRKNI
ncbi:hypothetical protein HELRODRAFT_108980 [Helobdella robusta]|uniref:Proline dehydrogenase n=1 Tax=Helobdella robusta TaxID=6412 RepID=T1EEP6_HELRO|nr:hypothetical protein HELRODRAFT_108980 [Helobdella robusta]ESO10545.1 hypothetical protein HELRODRAFT_108980 [Helobdella robusta]